jgi:hypothetical protein
VYIFRYCSKCNAIEIRNSKKTACFGTFYKQKATNNKICWAAIYQLLKELAECSPANKNTI